jgi:phenylacetate-CoA ligase
MLRTAAQQSTFILRALRDERRSPQRVRAMQDRALRQMVEHAWRSSAFCRSSFDAAGITPQDIRTVADLPKLPITTKAQLQLLGRGNALADGYTMTNTIEEATSGSSGKVLHIQHSREAYARYFAFAFRHLSAIGYRPWHRVAYTASEPLLPTSWERFGLGRREQVDLTDRDPRRYVEALLRINPHLITAYPSILQLIIGAATADELARIRPHAIHLHSELLTDGLRRQIREAFDADCFDDYSTFEFHHVAYECPAHRYHLASDNVIVEFVRDGQPVEDGQEGEILLTGLTNRAMPIFRYAIGDVGVPSTEICPCGRGFPVMQLIQGRVDDFVILPSGRRFSPRMINPVYEYLPGVLEHVLVQEALDHIVVYVNLVEEHRASTPDLITATLGELFGERIRLEVNVTTDIARGRTGKLRNVVSKVHNPVQNYDLDA